MPASFHLAVVFIIFTLIESEKRCPANPANEIQQRSMTSGGDCSLS